MEADVWHIESDRFKPNRLLVAVGASLVTTNGVTTDMVAGRHVQKDDNTIIGNANRFGRISGFVQVNSSYVIMTDPLNQCLRTVDRATHLTSMLAGDCGPWVRGCKDGPALSALFYFPWGIAYHEGMLYIADQFCFNVRQYDMKTATVSTLTHRIRHPRGLTLDTTQNKLYVTLAYNGIVEVDIANGTTRQLTSSQRGYRDGPIEASMFLSPYGIKLWNRERFVIADAGAHQLRLMDLRAGDVTSVCITNEACKLDKPYSVAFIASYLYVGLNNQIIRVKVISIDSQ